MYKKCSQGWFIQTPLNTAKQEFPHRKLFNMANPIRSSFRTSTSLGYCERIRPTAYLFN